MILRKRLDSNLFIFLCLTIFIKVKSEALINGQTVWAIRNQHLSNNMNSSNFIIANPLFRQASNVLMSLTTMPTTTKNNNYENHNHLINNIDSLTSTSSLVPTNSTNSSFDLLGTGPTSINVSDLTAATFGKIKNSNRTGKSSFEDDGMDKPLKILDMLGSLASSRLKSSMSMGNHSRPILLPVSGPSSSSESESDQPSIKNQNQNQTTGKPYLVFDHTPSFSSPQRSTPRYKNSFKGSINEKLEDSSEEVDNSKEIFQNGNDGETTKKIVTADELGNDRPTPIPFYKSTTTTTTTQRSTTPKHFEYFSTQRSRQGQSQNQPTPQHRPRVKSEQNFKNHRPDDDVSLDDLLDYRMANLQFGSKKNSGEVKSTSGSNANNGKELPPLDPTLLNSLRKSPERSSGPRTRNELPFYRETGGVFENRGSSPARATEGEEFPKKVGIKYAPKNPGGKDITNYLGGRGEVEDSEEENEVRPPVGPRTKPAIVYPTPSSEVKPRGQYPPPALPPPTYGPPPTQRPPPPKRPPPPRYEPPQNYQNPPPPRHEPPQNYRPQNYQNLPEKPPIRDDYRGKIPPRPAPPAPPQTFDYIEEPPSPPPSTIYQKPRHRPQNPPPPPVNRPPHRETYPPQTPPRETYPPRPPSPPYREHISPRPPPKNPNPNFHDYNLNSYPPPRPKNNHNHNQNHNRPPPYSNHDHDHDRDRDHENRHNKPYPPPRVNHNQNLNRPPPPPQKNRYEDPFSGFNPPERRPPPYGPTYGGDQRRPPDPFDDFIRPEEPSPPRRDRQQQPQNYYNEQPKIAKEAGVAFVPDDFYGSPEPNPIPSTGQRRPDREGDFENDHDDPRGYERKPSRKPSSEDVDDRNTPNSSGYNKPRGNINVNFESPFDDLLQHTYDFTRPGFIPGGGGGGGNRNSKNRPRPRDPYRELVESPIIDHGALEENFHPQGRGPLIPSGDPRNPPGNRDRDRPPPDRDGDSDENQENEDDSRENDDQRRPPPRGGGGGNFGGGGPPLDPIYTRTIQQYDQDLLQRDRPRDPPPRNSNSNESDEREEPEREEEEEEQERRPNSRERDRGQDQEEEEQEEPEDNRRRPQNSRNEPEEEEEEEEERPQNNRNNQRSKSRDSEEEEEEEETKERPQKKEKKPPPKKPQQEKSGNLDEDISAIDREFGYFVPGRSSGSFGPGPSAPPGYGEPPIQNQQNHRAPSIGQNPYGPNPYSSSGPSPSGSGPQPGAPGPFPALLG